MTHINGCILADLILEHKTDLTNTWFVNRKMISRPPAPIRLLAGEVIRGYVRLKDRIYKRQTR